MVSVIFWILMVVVPTRRVNFVHKHKKYYPSPGVWDALQNRDTLTHIKAAYLGERQFIVYILRNCCHCQVW